MYQQAPVGSVSTLRSKWSISLIALIQQDHIVAQGGWSEGEEGGRGGGGRGRERVECVVGESVRLQQTGGGRRSCFHDGSKEGRSESWQEVLLIV